MLLTDFRLAFRWFEVIYTQSLRSLGVTPRQFELLHFLNEQPGDGVKQTYLTQISGIDRSTAAASLALLEEKGLVRRTAADDDQRVKRVALTAKGRETLKAGRSLEDEARQALAERTGDLAAAFLQILPRLSRREPF